MVIEEFTHLRKSKPVILAAGMIWAIIAYEYATASVPHATEEAVRHFLTEFAELFLFLLTAMTYVNAMSERRVFAALRSWLVNRQYSYRKLFWITGILAFFLSPVIDNLTTALVMCAVLLAVGKDNTKFVSIGCVNIVVAANAGGAFSPFGDITTLMVWQRGVVGFETFFALFIPSVVNYLVPAAVMSLAVPNLTPATDGEIVTMKRGARIMMFLFGCTIATAVSFHNFLHLPPFLGMMTGLGYLQIFGYYLRRTHVDAPGDMNRHRAGEVTAFDSFREIARAEWDTLLFFFGVIMCVGGLGFIGYLDHLSQFAYFGARRDGANMLVGWRHLGNCRQHPGHGGSSAMNPRYGCTPAMVAGYVDRRRRWQSAVDRLGRRRCADGPGTRPVHVLFSPEVDAGDCRRLRTQYLGSLPG